MKNDDLIIWMYVPVICQDRQGRRFYGDVPIVRFNSITGKYELIENARGKAYAARHRQKHMKRKLKHKEKHA